MNTLAFYEKKIISDSEFPIQLFMNNIRRTGEYFYNHWHEHIELHYVMEGQTDFVLNHQRVSAREGTLVIINGNELHQGFCRTPRMDACVIIFEMDALSRELAYQNIIFHSLITGDEEIKRLIMAIQEENEAKELGYKLAVKGRLLQLITYLVRNYAQESLTEKESSRRRRNLNRLNTVIQYIQEHYAEPVTNRELADLIHISEDRFNHLFKESMGMGPLRYISEIRLKKAKNLLEKKNCTVSEAALEVGYRDFNHFTRQFQKYYGCTPSGLLKK